MSLGRKAGFSTLVEVLEYRATDRSGTSQNTAFVFLKDGEQVSDSLTFRELDQKARSLAGYLQALTRSGDRVLLAYPPGLEFIVAFFGCIYAGLIAVPAVLPARSQSIERLQLIAHDSQATTALTLSHILEKTIKPAQLKDMSLNGLRWLASDSTIVGPCSELAPPQLMPTDIAFLQYTSGSTRFPRGVVVRHSNILANVHLMQETFPLNSHDTAVSWLPLHHDMGLIGKVIGTLFCGSKCVLFPAKAFLMRPYRWVKLISEFRARLTAAPNFAYELCARRVTSIQKQSLDLSSLEFALNGSESVRAATVHRFTQAFMECGLRRGTMVPVYGLAEATLFVTANRSLEPTQWPRTLTISKRTLGAGKACAPSATVDGLEVCSVGKVSIDDHKVVVLDPVDMTRVPEDTVGEIIVKGASVASGYWRPSDGNQDTFTSAIPGEEGPFLRTGDLGFIHDEHVYITGRRKEVMVFSGRNIYPQDIEATVERMDSAFRIDGCAVFAEEGDTKTHLVIVQEIETGKRPLVQTLSEKIHVALAEQHDVFGVAAILLVKVGHIPRTSSGKIQRILCKELWQSNRLETIWEWKPGQGFAEGGLKHETSSRANTLPDRSITRSSAGKAQCSRPILATEYVAPQSESEKLLASIWQDLLGISLIGIHDEFINLGGHSLLAVQLLSQVRLTFHVDLPLGALFECTTIARLAKRIDSILQDREEIEV